MLRKAMAVHTLVLIVMMAMFAVVGLWLLYQWSQIQQIQANVTTCTFKRLSYCTDWKANTYQTPPWNWNDKEPKGCEAEGIGITRPLKKEDCEGIA